MTSMMKSLAIASTAAILLGATAPNVFAQAATTLGGGGASRSNGGAAGAGGTSGTAGTTGSAGASSGAASGEVGSRAESAAKGNDPSGTNGATNNRY